MNINIIIPAYNAHETIRQAVASVAMQNNINDIKVTIVDDCSIDVYDYLLTDFHYITIEVLRKPTNTGCGQTRQYGIDRCDCEYMMFMDADDCLYSPDAVEKLVQLAEMENAEYVISDFAEELDNGEYYLHEGDRVFVHGKLYKTSFIKEHDIRFGTARYSENHVFNVLVNSMKPKLAYLEHVTYLWKNNMQSTVRANDHYKIVMEGYFECADYVTSEIYRRHLDTAEIINTLTSYLMECYRSYNILINNRTPSDKLNIFEARLKKFYLSIPNKYRSEFKWLDVINDFYNFSPIVKMIEGNIIMILPFLEYIEILNKWNAE